MFLKKFKPLYTSVRNKKKIVSFLSYINNHLSLKKKFFKKKIKKNHKFLKKKYIIINNYAKNSYLGIYSIINWIKVPYSNKFITCCRFSDGAITYKPAPFGFSFKRKYFNTFLRPFEVKNITTFYVRKNFFFKPFVDIMHYNYLFFFRSHAAFYYIFSWVTKRTYATAGGTKCRLIWHNFRDLVYYIQLPSKKRIFVNIFSTGFIGRNSNIFAKYYFFSSFKQKQQIKKHHPKNRGVSMNPIDHPNGGSSKVKKPFLTPWGKIAKNNK